MWHEDDRWRRRAVSKLRTRHLAAGNLIRLHDAEAEQPDRDPGSTAPPRVGQSRTVLVHLIPRDIAPYRKHDISTLTSSRVKTASNSAIVQPVFARKRGVMISTHFLRFLEPALDRFT